MYGRVLWSVIRTIGQGYRWCEQYRFTSRQKKEAEGLKDALVLDKSDSTDWTVISGIDKLGLGLFWYERREISKGDFGCPVYRFLVML